MLLRLVALLDPLLALIVGFVSALIYLRIREQWNENNGNHRDETPPPSIPSPSPPNSSPLIDKEEEENIEEDVLQMNDVIDNLGDESGKENDRQIPYRRYMNLSEEEMLLRSQTFYELLRSRRSVRQLSTRPVPQKLIENLIKTAGTIDPITVNPDPKVKQRIRQVVEQEEQVNYQRRMGQKWVNDLAHLKTNWQKPYLTDAPFLIVVLKQIYQIDSNGQRQPTYYNEISASIATGILLTAIQNVGLVTVTTTPLNAGNQIRQILERPDNEKVLVLLPVGYEANGVTVPDIKRKRLEKILKLY